MKKRGERLGAMLSAQSMPNQWIILPPPVESTQMSTLLCRSEGHSQYAMHDGISPLCSSRRERCVEIIRSPTSVDDSFTLPVSRGQKCVTLITVSIRVPGGSSLTLRVNLSTFFSMFTGWSSTENSKNSRRLWPGHNRKVCENQLSVQWSGWGWPGDHPAGPSSAL